MGTNFYTIYCNYLDRITDDMYMETTMEETFEMMESLLLASIPAFKFPRFRLFKYDANFEALFDEEDNLVSKGAFEDTLTLEEINIFAELMVIEWLERQLATTRLVKQRYSGPDFKFTSQASHMQRLQAIIESRTKENSRTQAMYNRRIIDEDGFVRANYSNLNTVSSRKFIELQRGTLSALERREGLL